MPQHCKSSVTAIMMLLFFSFAAAQTNDPNQSGDPRNIKNGSVIPDEGYSDQPYVIITNDGAWLCVMTTGKEDIGDGGAAIQMGKD